MATRAVKPVMTPSSTSITVRPGTGIAGRYGPSWSNGHAPRSFASLRQWCDDFHPVSDTQVAELLNSSVRQRA